MADGVDIDLYADTEDFNQDTEFNANGDVDLYDDVITSRPASDSVIDEQVKSETKAQVPVGSSQYHGKRVALCVGNLTWWTTDQDLTDAITGLGVQDLLEIKFYENRANGQSKGFCVVTLGSDNSMRLVMEKLARKELHGQNPVVTHCNRQAVSQFEAQARKDAPPSNNEKHGEEFRGGMRFPGQQPPGFDPRGGPPRGAPPRGFPPRQGPPPGQGPPMVPGGPPRFGGDFHGGPPRGPPQGPPPGIQGPPRGPPMGMIMQRGPPQGPPRGPPQHGPHPHDPRGPPPRPEWDRPPGPFPGGPGGPPPHMMQGPPQMGMPPGQFPPPGMPPQQMPPQMPPQMGPAPIPHVNPAFFQGQPPQGVPPPVSMSGQVIPGDPFNRHGPPMSQPPYGGPPVVSYPSQDAYRPPTTDRAPPAEPQLTEQEFEEHLSRNKNVSSSAISRAVQDASAGEYASAIETLVTAISLIKQSKIANDDRCKILISSLQDTLRGIEDKSYGSAAKSSGSGSSRRSRSREREPSSSNSSKRRHRSRSRDREYRERSRERDRYEDRGHRSERAERSERSEREYSSSSRSSRH